MRKLPYSKDNRPRKMQIEHSSIGEYPKAGPGADGPLTDSRYRRHPPHPTYRDLRSARPGVAFRALERTADIHQAEAYGSRHERTPKSVSPSFVRPSNSLTGLAVALLAAASFSQV